MNYNNVTLNSDKSVTYPCNLLKDIEKIRIIFNVNNLDERAEQLAKRTRFSLLDASKLMQLEQLLECNDVLSDRCIRVLIDYYDGGFTQREIAELEHVSVSRIGQILHESLLKLYKVLYR